MYKNKLRLKDYELYIFDLDGTIVDSKDLMSEALKKCYLTLGNDEPPYERFFSLMGESIENIFSYLNIPLELTHMYKEHCLQQQEKIKIFPNMKWLLEFLVKGEKKLAIYTGKDRKRTIEILKTFDILHYFNLVITSDDVTRPKPNPEGVEYVMKQLRVDRDSTILIGDGLFDVECAKSANIKSAFVLWGTGQAADIYDLSPDYVFYNINELIGAITGKE